jgi:hypothetical protein
MEFIKPSSYEQVREMLLGRTDYLIDEQAVFSYLRG